MIRTFALVLLLAPLAACGSPNDPGVGGVTRGEAEALNQAAEMIDNNAVAPVAEPANTAGR